MAQVVNISDDFKDFQSVKDVDITRYKSSLDVKSLNSFKTCSGDDDLSLCSKMSDRFWFSCIIKITWLLITKCSSGAGTVGVPCRRVRIQHHPSRFISRSQQKLCGQEKMRCHPRSLAASSMTQSGLEQNFKNYEVTVPMTSESNIYLMWQVWYRCCNTKLETRSHQNNKKILQSNRNI